MGADEPCYFRNLVTGNQPATQLNCDDHDDDLDDDDDDDYDQHEHDHENYYADDSEEKTKK